MNVIMHKSHDNDSVQGAYCSVCVCNHSIIVSNSTTTSECVI